MIAHDSIQASSSLSAERPRGAGEEQQNVAVVSGDGQQVLPVEVFLAENYAFRFNILSNKTEMRERRGGVWRHLDQKAFNSIVVEGRRQLPDERSLKTQLREIIDSEATPVFAPFEEFVSGLPKWDGIERVDALFRRLPGVTDVKVGLLRLFLRSFMAHALWKCPLHANEIVPVLIGEQGCGKSTFWLRLLPPCLREFYLDHVNLSNKFDKEMALTNNLLVNLDEMDQIRPSQQAELKQMISKVRVNGRMIYGREQSDRQRFASFVATTNNRHPLRDDTGSRRFLCIELTPGRLVDNVTEIDYDQLYAQVLFELERGDRYWFTPSEERAIQNDNLRYQSFVNYEAMVERCFRRAAPDEDATALTVGQISTTIGRTFPRLKLTHSAKVHIGLALSRLGYPQRKSGNNSLYYAVPIDAALSA